MAVNMTAVSLDAVGSKVGEGGTWRSWDLTGTYQNIRIALNQVSETDLALPATVRVALVRTVGQAAETDTAIPITRQTAGYAIGEISQISETPEQIAVEAIVSGQPATDVAAVLQYRLNGQTTWIDAHPLYRHDPLGTEDRYRGCIFGLNPGSTYELQVIYTNGTNVDTRGTAQHGTFTTRALPADVSGQTPDYTPSTISALNTAIAAAVPGDVIELQDGTYNLTSDLSVDCSGTLGNEIYIRGETQSGVIINGSSGFSTRIIGDYIVFENMTLQGDSGAGTRAIYLGQTGPDIIVTDITIRDITSTNYGRGVNTAGGSTGTNSHRILVYNCSFTGVAAWNVANITTNTYWNSDGLRLVGHGNCAWNNTLEGHGDSITFSHSASETSIYANYAYRNKIRNSVDDCFEFDYSYGLMAAYDNYCENIRPLMSMDPVNRGPVYCFRNVAVNIATRPFKLNSSGTGFLIYNNTILRSETYETGDSVADSTAGFKVGWGKLNAATCDRIAYRNNIFLYTQGLVTGTEVFLLRNLAATTGSSVDWTNNVHYPDIAIDWRDDAGQNRFTNLADAQANIRSTNPLFPSAAGLGAPTARHSNDAISELQPFETAITLGTDASTEVTGAIVPTLSAGVAAKNAGVVIPNITDSYSGAAPDMGAIIEGRASVFYGASDNLAPSWATALALDTWTQVGAETWEDTMLQPNELSGWTSGAWGVSGPKSTFSNTWNGAALIKNYGAKGAIFFWAGGHANYFGNEVTAFDLDTLTYTRLTNPDYVGIDFTADFHADGLLPNGNPRVPHNFYTIISDGDRLITCRRERDDSGSSNVHMISVFNPSTLQWTSYTDEVGATSRTRDSCCFDTTRNLIWFTRHNPLGFSYADPDVGTWTDVSATGAYDGAGGCVYIPTKDCIVAFSSDGTVLAYDPGNPAGGKVILSPTGSGPTQTRGDGTGWSSNLGKILYRPINSNAVYTLTPPAGDWATGTWAWSQISVSGTPGPYDDTGPRGKFVVIDWDDATIAMSNEDWQGLYKAIRLS